MPIALALLGPGLDGQLAIELMRRLRWQIVAATFATPFTSYHQSIVEAAHRLGVELITLTPGEDYLHRVAHPRFGYSREMAPCLDCKVAMLAAARERMTEMAADCLVTGDVVGQRLPGQSKRDLALVDFHSDVERKVLRPLSGALLPPTDVETKQQILRSELLSVQGRGRQQQLALAKKFGWQTLPAVTSGCQLADSAYARRLSEAIEHEPSWKEAIPLLALGRHFRLPGSERLVLGRNAEENAKLSAFWAQRADALLVQPANFTGPTAYIAADVDDESRNVVAHLVVSYSKKPLPNECALRFITRQGETTLVVDPNSQPALPAPI